MAGIGAPLALVDELAKDSFPRQSSYSLAKRDRAPARKRLRSSFNVTIKIAACGGVFIRRRPP